MAEKIIQTMQGKAIQVPQEEDEEAAAAWAQQYPTGMPQADFLKQYRDLDKAANPDTKLDIISDNSLMNYLFSEHPELRNRIQNPQYPRGQAQARKAEYKAGVTQKNENAKFTLSMLNMLPAVGGVAGAAAAVPLTGGTGEIPMMSLGAGGGRLVRDYIAEGLGLEPESSLMHKGLTAAGDTALTFTGGKLMPPVANAIMNPGRTLSQTAEAAIPTFMRNQWPELYANLKTTAQSYRNADKIHPVNEIPQVEGELVDPPFKEGEFSGGGRSPQDFAEHVDTAYGTKSQRRLPPAGEDKATYHAPERNIDPNQPRLGPKGSTFKQPREAPPPPTDIPGSEPTMWHTSPAGGGKFGAEYSIPINPQQKYTIDQLQEALKYVLENPAQALKSGAKATIKKANTPLTRATAVQTGKAQSGNIDDVLKEIIKLRTGQDK